MTRKPTLSERKTVAMLMGGWYDWRDNTINIDPSPQGHSIMLDADTFQPTPQMHFVQKAGEHGTIQHILNVDRLPCEVQWVRNDDDE